MQFTTKSQHADVLDVARLAVEISESDFSHGSLEDKLYLMVRLADRAASGTEFKPEIIELAIKSGMADHLLDEIKSAVARREGLLASERLNALSIGQRITISDSVRPKLLAGCPCEVTGFQGESVKVTLLATRSDKWRLGMTVTLPKSLIGE